MNTMNNALNAVFDFLGTPLTVEEFNILGLQDSTLERLAGLIENEKMGVLTTTQAAELEAFKEAAFYMRMGNRTE